MSRLTIEQVKPTVFLRDTGNGILNQSISVLFQNSGEPLEIIAAVSAEGRDVITPLGIVSSGESEHDIFAAEISSSGMIEVALRCQDDTIAQRKFKWNPPKRWTVHLVHVSHHDAGYTDLFDNVLDEHTRFLESVLDMADAAQDNPDESQFRMVVEQAWSINHFFANTTPANAARMEKLLKSGHVEVTAWFGNMVSHLCGHETLIRALYPAFELRQRLGIPIISAEHNDVPGMSWGMAEALIDAGVSIFLPDLPHYWEWGNLGLQGFWNQNAIFGHDGPGAVWWEAPSGRRLLLWASNECSGKTFKPWLPDLAPRLQELTDQNWPYDVFRCQCRGGQRDNSPYTIEYTNTVKRWNAEWAYPHLICSTNARFYKDLLPQLPENLPVVRGDLPDQDYPVGAASTANATAVNRGNHIQIPSAEIISSMACLTADHKYPTKQIAKAYEEMLWHDEHTWGTGGPRFGPGPETSEIQKSMHAHQARSLAHDVTRKAAARIADYVKIESDDFHLVIFNSLAHSRSACVAASLWEMENCGSEMISVTDSMCHTTMQCVNLTDRNSLHLPDSMLDGQFDLIDIATSRLVPFQIDMVSEFDEPIPYGARRYGTGLGGKRLGILDAPTGTARTLKFIAQDVPACGYRTFQLRPRQDFPQFTSMLSAASDTIENEYLRVEVDTKSGKIASILDKKTNRELLDINAPHSLGEIIVRNPSNVLASGLENIVVTTGHNGPISASIIIRGSIYGHPKVAQSITLTEGQRRIELATYILKDATPLLDVHMAFPFRLDTGGFKGFKYDGVLGVIRPIIDYMPGSYSDAICVQNWIKASDESLSVLWSSMDAAVVGLGGLQPGYVSPAHSCIISNRSYHPPMTEQDLDRSWIYSNLFANNFGTNFSINQCGEFLFRHVITPYDTDISDSKASMLGYDAMTPLEPVFTKGSKHSTLATVGSMLQIDNPAISLLTWKRAEDGNGWILRFRNNINETSLVNVKLPLISISAVHTVSVVEEDLRKVIQTQEHEFTIEIQAQSLKTVRLLAL